jgi:glycosyltransferase involved in cell wall biosynthesis
MTRKRILCLLPDLNGGGAERVMLYLCRGLDRAEWDITLGLGQRRGPYVPLIPPDIEVIELGHDRAAYAVRDVGRLFRTGGYDLCFSMVSMNLAAVAARELSRSKIKLVLGARNHYSKSMPAEASASRAKMLAIRLLYPRSDLVISVSEGVQADLVAHFGLPLAKARAIHNPIDIERVREEAKADPGHPWLPGTPDRPVLVAVGKLQVAKGYPYLLEAFRRIRQRVPARLIILGEGPERGAIEAVIARHDLADDVALLGFQTNPYQYLARSSLFVHAALWEGFPNVLVEAMACGLVVVSTDCPSGPAEVITSGRDGLLVPVADAPALARAVLELLERPDRLDAMRIAAAQTVTRFSIERVLAQYDAAFHGVLGERHVSP